MTVTSDTSLPFDFSDVKRSERSANRASAIAEIREMSDAMVKEGGLINHAQAGLVLDVSTKRIGELVRLRKLTRFDFMGRTYVSMNEVNARREADVSAGRPKRSVAKQVAVAVVFTAITDGPQLLAGGLDGAFGKSKPPQNKKEE